MTSRLHIGMAVLVLAISSAHAQSAEELRREAAVLEPECLSLERVAIAAEERAAIAAEERAIAAEERAIAEGRVNEERALALAELVESGPRLSNPYVFQVEHSRLSVKIGPGSNETAFTVLHGESLRAVQLVKVGITHFVEVEKIDSSARGFVSHSLAGELASEAIRSHYAAIGELERPTMVDPTKVDDGVEVEERQRAIECNRQLSSLRRKANIGEQNREYFASTPDVLIERFGPSNPNSAGGVDLGVSWRFLNPHKTVRYIHFTARPYNRVGDIQHCSIRGYSAFTGYSTGPYEASRQIHQDGWGTPWYNNDISCVRLTRVRVEYTDGSSYTYARELPSILAEGVTNSCTMEAQR